MYDYNGPLDRLKARLYEAGIYEEELDIEDYAGLTYSELDGIVQTAIARKKAYEEV